MPATTPIYGWRYQLAGDAPDGAGLGQNLGLDIEATVAANIATINANAANLAAQHSFPATPLSTSANGTSTSGAIETRDAVLGDYTFTALAGVRYRVVLSNVALFGSGTVLGDRYTINIRNGGASTPTSASPLVAQTNVVLVGAGFIGDSGHYVTGTFKPGAGAVTLSAFVLRVTGTGTVLPIFLREFYAEAVGLV